MENKATALTTLCYLEKENRYLMLHRVSKKNDQNKGKWIGVGGHFEPGESPEECLHREVKEETGYTLKGEKFRAVITFVSPNSGTEYMFLYTADQFEGIPIDCNEGTLEWIEKDKIMELNLWEGDRYFLKALLSEEPYFSMKLVYDRDDRLLQVFRDGEILFDGN